jgi:hypothetical protein
MFRLFICILINVSLAFGSARANNKSNSENTYPSRVYAEFIVPLTVSEIDAVPLHISTLYKKLKSQNREAELTTQFERLGVDTSKVVGFPQQFLPGSQYVAAKQSVFQAYEIAALKEITPKLEALMNNPTDAKLRSDAEKTIKHLVNDVYQFNSVLKGESIQKRTSFWSILTLVMFLLGVALASVGSTLYMAFAAVAFMAFGWAGLQSIGQATSYINWRNPLKKSDSFTLRKQVHQTQGKIIGLLSNARNLDQTLVTEELLQEAIRMHNDASNAPKDDQFQKDYHNDIILNLM